MWMMAMMALPVKVSLIITDVFCLRTLGQPIEYITSSPSACCSQDFTSLFILNIQYTLSQSFHSKQTHSFNSFSQLFNKQLFNDTNNSSFTIKMKFSTIAGVAAFVSGAYAAPQPAGEAEAVTAVAKRVDLASTMPKLSSEVADVIKQAESLSATVQSAGSLGGASFVGNLTSGIVTLNISLSGVVDLLNELGLGSLDGPVENAVGEAESATGGLLSLATGAVSTVLGTTSNLLGGVTGGSGGGALGGLGGLTGGLLRKDTGSLPADPTSAVTDALGGLTNASALTSLIGGLLTAVGDLLGNLTDSITGGSLGDLSSLTNLTNITSGAGALTGGLTGGLTGSGSGSDPVSELSGTLQGLVQAAVSLLGNLLGGL